MAVPRESLLRAMPTAFARAVCIAEFDCYSTTPSSASSHNWSGQGKSETLLRPLPLSHTLPARTPVCNGTLPGLLLLLWKLLGMQRSLTEPPFKKQRESTGRPLSVHARSSPWNALQQRLRWLRIWLHWSTFG